MDALVVGQEIEAALHAGQHAQGEDVDFHELQRIDVVLVPFDDLAIDHGSGLDRHQLVEPVVGQDKTTGMLGEMARGAHELAGEIERQAKPSIAEV